MGFDLFKHLAEKKPHLITPDGACLIWNGTMQHGYPRICVKKVFYWPRSEMYEKKIGKFTRGRDVITLKCGNSRCLNHKHMELIQRSESIKGISLHDGHAPIKHSGTLSYLFQNKADKLRRDGHCYVWVENTFKGAPRAYINGKTINLRPVIYAENHQPFDKSRSVVRLTCGENGCLNPLHMGLVPINQASIDYHQAGKHRNITSVMKRTLSCQNRKLAFNDVAEIRNSDKNNKELAHKFNVTVRTIQAVRSYSRFKVIPTAFGLLKVA